MIGRGRGGRRSRHSLAWLKRTAFGRLVAVHTMSTPDIPIHKDPARVRLPRWPGAILFAVVHGVVPWRLSLLTRRHGWSERGPSRWNLLGLPLVATGTAVASWGMVLHVVAAPEGWEWEQSQPYLLERGPYMLSRNPMYLGEVVLWLGWAVFYGSVADVLGCCLWLVVFRFVVPQEERALEARYGEDYRAYARRVPRWLGVPRRATG
jgi:protein-S-isoprenylcysteine O-methyltransferase Ste14